MSGPSLAERMVQHRLRLAEGEMAAFAGIVADVERISA